MGVRGRIATGYRVFRHRHLDNFVFIHINKTGGSSVEKALRLPFEHKTASEKIGELGLAEWSRRYTFSIVRNPWDKVVSHYHYRVQTNQTDLASHPIPFSDWVRRTYGAREGAYYDNPKMFMPQSAWITDAQGKTSVKHICRFENLQADFLEVCANIGASVQLPHVKASKRGHYHGYYDEETSRIVGEWFTEDLERFGYTF